MVLFPGLPELCVFFQQIMRYFLANYAPKILNYAKIMQIALTIFLSKKFLMFQFSKLANQAETSNKHLITGPRAVCR